MEGGLLDRESLQSQTEHVHDFMPNTFLSAKKPLTARCGGKGKFSEMPELVEGAEEMRVDPARAKVLVESLEQVVKRVDAVRGSRKVCICLEGVVVSYRMLWQD